MITYIVTDQGREAYEELSRALQQLEEMVNLSPSDVMAHVNSDNIYYKWNEFAGEFGRHFHNPTQHGEELEEREIAGRSHLDEDDIEEFVGEGWLERNDPDEDIIDVIHYALQKDEWLFRLGTPDLNKKIRALTPEQKGHIRNLNIEPANRNELSNSNSYNSIKRFFLHCIEII